MDNIRIIACLFPIVFLIFSLNVSAKGQTVFNEVYYDNLSIEGHFSNIEDAIANVADGGIVYIRKNIKLKNTLEINKSMKIVSLDPKEYEIMLRDEDVAFSLEDIDYFKVEGIKSYSTNSNNKLIAGVANTISIENSYFQFITPMYIKNPNKNMNISISNSHFQNSNIKINMGNYEGNIYMSNNLFNVLKPSTPYIWIINSNIEASNNEFDNYAFRIDGEMSIAEISDNVFTGSGKIMIRDNGEKIHFNRNKILKYITDEIYYSGTSNIDFTENWWGDRDGPRESRIYGKVDYSNWALFEDFSRFKNDPYKVEDVQKGAVFLGQTVDNNTFIYDLDKNEIIEFLDLIYMTRKID